MPYGRVSGTVVARRRGASAPTGHAAVHVVANEPNDSLADLVDLDLRAVRDAVGPQPQPHHGLGARLGARVETVEHGLPARAGEPGGVHAPCNARAAGPVSTPPAFTALTTSASGLAPDHQPRRRLVSCPDRVSCRVSFASRSSLRSWRLETTPKCASKSGVKSSTRPVWLPRQYGAADGRQPVDKAPSTVFVGGHRRSASSDSATLLNAECPYGCRP